MNDKIIELRNLLFAEIKRCLAEDGHCKHYEGRVSLQWPGYFDDDYVVELDCYLIGPSRHYSWRGVSHDDALAKALADVRVWIAENEADDYNQSKDG